MQTISERIRHIRATSKLTQQEFAGTLGITQGNLSLIESGKILVNLETLTKICQLYKVEYSWLIDGALSYGNLDHLIPLVDTKASAGYPKQCSEMDYIDRLPKYRIPGFDEGDYRIYQISGESMQPTLIPNDYVVCIRVDNIERIVSGSLIVIVTHHDIYIRRLRANTHDSVILDSDNALYKSYEIRKNEITEVWAIQTKITQALNYIHFPLLKAIDTLQTEIETLKKEIRDIQESQ